MPRRLARFPWLAVLALVGGCGRTPALADVEPVQVLADAKATEAVPFALDADAEARLDLVASGTGTDWGKFDPSSEPSTPPTGLLS